MSRTPLLLVLFSIFSLAAWSQNTLWQQDTNWVNTGWASSNLGYWEDIRDVCPWGSDAAAVAIQVYALDGGSQPAIVKATLDSEVQAFFPFDEDVERPIQIEEIASDASDRLWCAMNQLSHDSAQTSIGGLWVLDQEGMPDASIGTESLPGWIPIGFGSPFQELHGLDAALEDSWMVSGMVLDPCCFHREMPTLALLDSNGEWVSSFGNNGRLILDVGAVETIDTLGMRPALSRHEIGGFYSSAVETNGGWIAGGAYSNASHYEVLVAKHSDNGTLDTTFGESGIVHLNLNPGVNHWVQDIRLESNGFISINVVSHAAGDLPSGWHALTLDEAGTPVQWETTESNASWTSIGFVDASGPLPLGVGFEEGASTPSLVSYSSNLGTAPEMTLLEPLLSPEGFWNSFQCEYHPNWDRLLISGRWQSNSNETDPDPLALFSLWQQDFSSILPDPTAHFKKSNPYPNPIRPGEVLHLDHLTHLQGSSGDWILTSLNGVEASRWPADIGLKSLTIGLDIHSGVYILTSAHPSGQRFQLIIE